MKIRTSYVICAVQRSGSFLLCEALKNTGLTGFPEEYFLYHPDRENLEKGDGARQHGTTTRREFIELVKEKGTTANGVFGVKQMWNGFRPVVAALQELPGCRNLDPYPLLAALFPNLQFIWMVRRDTVAPAVSWAIAAPTGIYAAWQAEIQPPLQEPVYDCEQIDHLHRLVLEGEAGWRAYFEANGISPLKVVYEDLVGAYEETAFRVLDFLGVPYPDGLVFGERMLKKQATQINRAWASKYRKAKSLA